MKPGTTALPWLALALAAPLAAATPTTGCGPGSTVDDAAPMPNWWPFV